MATKKSKIVRVPVDILNDLDRNLPGLDMGTKFHIMHRDHLEMRKAKKFLKSANEFIYGAKKKK